MKLKTCFADMLWFIVEKIQKNDTLELFNLIIFIFCVFKVLQCMALGVALDKCLCFSFARRVSYRRTQ